LFTVCIAGNFTRAEGIGAVPSRIVREGILDSERVDRLSEPAENFYRRLMSVVDDYGRYEADAVLLRAKCYPRRAHILTVPDIEQRLRETLESGLVVVYRNGRKQYLQVVDFGQRVRSESKFPAPPPEVLKTLNPKPCLTHVSRCLTHVSSPPTDARLVVCVGEGAQSNANANANSAASGVETPEPASEPHSQSARETNAAAESVTDRCAAIGGWMAEYAEACNLALGVPDKRIVGQAEAACRGQPLEAVHEFLVKLHERGRKPGKSYGWFVSVLEDEFGNRKEIIREHGKASRAVRV
jgi:hypothetical protein